MVELVCCGDIAITEDLLPDGQWVSPCRAASGIETKVLFNWELPCYKSINLIPRKSGPRLVSNLDSVKVIENWAPGFAALATNHIIDAGEEGLTATIATLTQAGFLTVGAGQCEQEIKKPIIWETNEGRLGVINWVFPQTNPDWGVIPGPNCWPGLEKGMQAVRKLKDIVDWVLVFPHWSNECFPYPTPSDREIAKGLVDAGADVVIGHHPHVVRGSELIHGKHVFYSLGNYYFSTTRNQFGGWIVRPAPRNREALVVKVTFQRGSAPRSEAFSYWQGSNKTEPDPLHRAVRRMRKTSKPLIQLFGEDYFRWYQKRYTFFNRWEYRLHFSLWQKGWNGIIRYPFILLNRKLG